MRQTTDSGGLLRADPPRPVVLQDIPENVKNALEIVPVKWIDKVLEIALERQPEALAEEEAAAAATPAPEGRALPPRLQ